MIRFITVALVPFLTPVGALLGALPASAETASSTTAAPAVARLEGVDIRKAVDAMAAGDFVTARAIAHDLAASGDPDAHYMLGHLYANGQSVVRDMTRAVTHYVKAASTGQPNAQFALGELAYTGDGAVQDWARAAGWYNLAASKGHLLAKVRLGYMYAEGQSVPQDASRAALLFEEAAKAGEMAAQYHLALLYLDGEGKPQDFAQAARWFRAAATQGDADSMYNLALILESGRAGETDLPGAVQWMGRAASAGILPAKVSMGLLHFNGRGVDQSNDEAARWFLDAATGGSAEGMFLYAVGLAEGLTGKPNLNKALVWAQKSVDASEGEPAEILDERVALRNHLRKITEARRRDGLIATSIRQTTRDVSAPSMPFVPLTQKAAQKAAEEAALKEATTAAAAAEAGEAVVATEKPTPARRLR